MGMGSLLPVFSSTAGTEGNFRCLAALTSACPTELGEGGSGFYRRATMASERSLLSGSPVCKTPI